MSVVGPRPESGVRVEVERSPGGPPWRYGGAITTPSARYLVSATVEEDGAVSVELPIEAPAALRERARLILRAAAKHARGSAPPRRIARWRAEATGD
ncbi:MAG: hypothetical protein JOZ69_00955 [Myxococcales bacterium]|nr:hypothetical protein [Myxococcales bacterium]